MQFSSLFRKKHLQSLQEQSHSSTMNKTLTVWDLTAFGIAAIIGAGNVPGTGGNTGTAEGFLGDLNGGAIRSRQIELEFLWRY